MLHSSDEHPPPPQQETHTSYAAAYDNQAVYEMSVDNPGAENGAAEKPKKRFNIELKSFSLPMQTGYMNTSYLATLSAYFKIGEAALSFIAFLCAVSTCRSSNASWTEYTTWTNSIVPLVYLALYVIFPHVTNEETTKQGLIFTELLYYVTGAVFNFISFCLMASVASYKEPITGILLCRPVAPAIISCVFCIFLTIVFAADAFFKFKALRRGAGSDLPPPQNGITQA